MMARSLSAAVQRVASGTPVTPRKCSWCSEHGDHTPEPTAVKARKVGK